MASITRRAGHRSVSFRVAVKVGATRNTGTFPTLAEAKRWAAQREAELRAIAANLAANGGSHGNTLNAVHQAPRQALASRTLGDLLERYAREESIKKGGARWEQVRLALMARDPFAAVRLSELTAAVIADWRDRRAGFKPSERAPISQESVRREMVILSAALRTAVDEWGWLPASPLSGVTWPKKGESRSRRIAPEELERLAHTCGHEPGKTPRSVRQRVYLALLFAIETAMREGEIARLTWTDVDVKARVARVQRGKSAAARREVPLSRAAGALIELMRPTKSAGAQIFLLTADQISSNFAAAAADAAIADLNFHDSRHESITRLAARMDVLDLARMVGHRDLRQLMVYYNRSAADLAKDLD